MTDQSVRDRIAHIVMYGTEGENEWTDDPGEVRAEAIIGIVREELLSQNALEAAADIWNNHHAPTCDRAIQAAWEAAFGTDDDG